MSPFLKGSLGSDAPLVYCLTSAVSLFLSTLLFYVIWRSPRLERWNGYREVLLFISTMSCGSYLGWVYAPAWGLPHMLGHVLGILGGAVLGFAIMIGEVRAINARKGALVAEQRRALDA